MVRVSSEPWNGSEEYALYTIEGPKLSVCVSNYGATVQRVRVLRQDGLWVDVTCGYDHVEDYSNRERNRYLGATAGRYANRIRGASFVIGGAPPEQITCTLPVNNGPNCLHGGIDGFNRRVFHAEVINDETMVGVRFTRLSKDGEEGFPSDLVVHVTYAIAVLHPEDLVMKFEVHNVGHVATHANVVNHNYWNLNGLSKDESAFSDAMATHELQLQCPWYCPVDAVSIPTGEILSVRGTAFDFTSGPKCLSKDIETLTATPQRGYDHALVFPHPSILTLSDRDHFYCRCVATRQDGWRLGRLKSVRSGIAVDMYSTFPAVQLYSGNYMPPVADAWRGYHGALMTYRNALCLEAEYLPDSPHATHFSSTVVHPGQRRVDWQVYSFSL